MSRLSVFRKLWYGLLQWIGGGPSARGELSIGQRRFLKRLGRRVRDMGMGSETIIAGRRYSITDGPNFQTQFKDVILHGIYDFDASRPDPLIIDGGSNIGMMILVSKLKYPHSRIIAFEPDPEIRKVLETNLARNGVQDVRIVPAALAGKRGKLTFEPDRSAGGKIADSGSMSIEAETLSGYLREPVDFLKLNIEGAELEVLEESASEGTLKNIREMVIEYHGWPHQQQRLGRLLRLLEDQGYRYLIHDFDGLTCSSSKPPFRLQHNTVWFCLVYAKREDVI